MAATDARLATSKSSRGLGDGSRGSLAALAPYGGEVLRTSLTAETEEEIAKVLTPV